MKEYIQAAGRLIPEVITAVQRDEVQPHPNLNTLCGVYHGFGRGWWKLKQVLKNGN